MAWITGKHAIRAAIDRRAAGTLYVVHGEYRNNTLVEQASRVGVAVRQVSASWLRSHAGGSARGIAFSLSETSSSPLRTLESVLDETSNDPPTGPILALDHITDPHNLGAILRSAWWFSAILVLLPSRRSAPITEVVHRSSAGAASLVPTAPITNLRNSLEQCRKAGWWIYAADAGGRSIIDIDFDARSVIVLGAEGKGLSDIVARTADERISIPTYTTGSSVDSLNVSVSAGVLLYEYRRSQL